MGRLSARLDTYMHTLQSVDFALFRPSKHWELVPNCLESPMDFWFNSAQVLGGAHQHQAHPYKGPR